MHYVYVLENKKGRYYIGSCEDLVLRLKRHNQNSDRSTKNNGPWILVYREECDTKTEARIKENQLKSFKGNSKFKKLTESMTPSSSLVRTRAFQALGRGSNPLGVINFTGFPARPFYSGRDPALELIPWREKSGWGHF